MFGFEFNFHTFFLKIKIKKSNIDIVLITCYNIITIEIDILQFHIFIINDLVFPFIMYLFSPNNLKKYENKPFMNFVLV